jgi:hypothetical protein
MHAVHRVAKLLIGRRRGIVSQRRIRPNFPVKRNFGIISV